MFISLLTSYSFGDATLLLFLFISALTFTHSVIFFSYSGALFCFFLPGIVRLMDISLQRYDLSFCKRLIKQIGFLLLLIGVTMQLIHTIPYDSSSLVSLADFQEVIMGIPFQIVMVAFLFVVGSTLQRVLFCYFHSQITAMRILIGSLPYLFIFFLFSCFTRSKSESTWLGSALLYLFAFVIEEAISISFFYSTGNRFTIRFSPQEGRMLKLFFWGCLLLTNIVTTHFFSFWGYQLTGGIIPYAITFLITDLLTEVYGVKSAREAVIGGFYITSVFSLVLIGISQWHSNTSTGIHYAAFKRSFAFMPGLLLASLVAYWVGQSLDLIIFSYLKKKTNGAHLWLRNNLATMTSQGVDTFLFAFVLFYVWPLIDPFQLSSLGEGVLFWQITWNEYRIKLLLAALDTPFLYFGCYLLRKIKSSLI